MRGSSRRAADVALQLTRMEAPHQVPASDVGARCSPPSTRPVLRATASVLLLLAVGMACSCSKPRVVRQATCPAPDGRAVATVMQEQGGGFGGTQFTEVLVHAPGASLDTLRGAFFTPDEIRVNLHAYWRGRRELVVEYPAVLSSGRLQGVVVLASGAAPDTVWVTPRPVRDMELNGSDVASCYPYRDGWPQTAPEPPRS